MGGTQAEVIITAWEKDSMMKVEVFANNDGVAFLSQTRISGSKKVISGEMGTF
jgi:hypothetical protein